MRIAIPLFALVLTMPSFAEPHDPSLHAQHMAAAQGSTLAADTRQLVHFPEQMRMHTLSSMRDHLLALQEIQASLARSDYEKAADVAETRLGMSALALHGAHESSKFMPLGMQSAGSAMHRAASRFAVIARDAAVTGEVKPAIGGLSEIMGACVACHAGYRLH